MRISFSSMVLAAGLFAAAAPVITAQRAADPPEWTERIAPFRIVGNIYYVGTADLGSFLITSEAGHFLLDTVVAAAAPQIESNIAALGFKLADVRFLLNSQAHFDHAAAFASFKAKSGATMVASEKDAALLERGGRSDPVMGDSGLFPPVKVDRVIKDGEELRLGDVRMTARLTPGHTPGSTTWMTRVSDGAGTLTVLFPSSTSVLPTARLAEPQSYPGMADDFARTFALLESFTPDVFLAAHGSMFDLRAKMARMKSDPSRNPFVDPAGYRTFIQGMKKQFQARLQRDRGGVRR